MSRIFNYVRCFFDKLINYPLLGAENDKLADRFVGLLLAISPLLQHYKGIGVNAGVLVLVLCLPYVCLKLLLRIRSLKWKNTLYALPLVLFQLYRIAAHGTSFMELAHCVVLCGYFVAISLGGINIKYVVQSAYLVAMTATVAIVVQSICFYVFRFHLQLVAADLLLEESSAWLGLVKTGIIGVNGKISAFYRPSAFFLEPSHMFLYFIPNLCLVLLTPGMNQAKRISAVFLSAGLLLSTSGMGVVLTVCVWLLQLGFTNGQENLLRFKQLFCKKNIRNCIIFVVIFALVAMCMPSLRYSILRIFVGSEAVDAMISAEEVDMLEMLEDTDDMGGSTAISGRIDQAISLVLYKMSGEQYIFGVSDSVDHIDFNLPGFFSTMYKYGIVGTVLSYVFYLCCAIFAKGNTRWFAVIVLAISFVTAHTHGTFYMLFYVLLLMSGIMAKNVVQGAAVENSNSI